MAGPYGTRWADIDEPAEVVDVEDRAFITALSVWNVRNALRPPESDEMPGQPWAPHPESLRGKVISTYLAVAESRRILGLTRRGRLLLWVADRYVALRHWFRR